jgi:hypothetical protein
MSRRMANDAPTHPIELHELFAKPTSKDVAQRMLQMITGYWMTPDRPRCDEIFHCR